MHAVRRMKTFSRLSSLVLSRECSNVTKQKWDIYCAVSLERLPVITKELNDIEKKTDEMLKQVEMELSHKSNFERRLEEDEKRQKLLKSGKIDIDELDQAGQKTGHDLLDSYTAELKSFKLAPREYPEEDKNLKSNKRYLDRHLLLLVKEKVGKTPMWVLPQGIRKEDETLKETATRILNEKCGSKIEAKFFGNAPNGFYKYKYPKSVNMESVGAKIFFYKALFLGGMVELQENTTEDYQWATRDELEILPRAYCKSVKMFLIDEH